jgi:hypothetical protein
VTAMNIGTLLPRHEGYRGGHPALVIGGRTLSYRELNAYVNRFANALLAAGLKKGDKFATILNHVCRMKLLASRTYCGWRSTYVAMHSRTLWSRCSRFSLDVTAVGRRAADIKLGSTSGGTNNRSACWKSS